MTNKATYQLRIDTNKLQILDDNYNSIIKKLIYDKKNDISDFKLQIINQDNVIDDELNTITNYYIEELFKEQRVFVITGNDYPKMIKDFIMTSVKVLKRKIDGYVFNDEYIIFEIFLGYDYFRINVKRDVISKEKYEEYMVLGPDYLVGNDLAYLKEVLPAFYSYLYENDGFTNDKINDLSKYKIGLS